jgi:hypothetical protein
MFIYDRIIDAVSLKKLHQIILSDGIKSRNHTSIVKILQGRKGD